MTIDDRLDLLGVNLATADIDDPATPTNEVTAIAAALDHVAGIDKPVRLDEAFDAGAQIAAGGPLGADAQRAVLDLDLDRAARAVDQACRKPGQPVADLEGDA